MKFEGFYTAIHDIKEMEPACTYINRQMDKENVVGINNGILFSCKQKWKD